MKLKNIGAKITFLRRALIVCAMSALPLSLWSQATAKSAFTTAPATVLPLLDNMTRLDMLDYYESGVSRPSKNLLEGNTQILSMTDNSIVFREGDIATTAFNILPYGKGEIIMVINTVKLPETDSRISFFTTKWEQLPTEKFFARPLLADWTGNLTKEQLLDLENALPFMTSEAVYNPETSLLTLTSTVLPMLDNESKTIAEPLLKNNLQYKWNGKKFTK